MEQLSMLGKLLNKNKNAIIGVIDGYRYLYMAKSSVKKKQTEQTATYETLYEGFDFGTAYTTFTDKDGNTDHELHRVRLLMMIEDQLNNYIGIGNVTTSYGQKSFTIVIYDRDEALYIRGSNEYESLYEFDELIRVDLPQHINYLQEAE